MGRYRKKPVVIDAFHMPELGEPVTNEDWPEWMHMAWQGERDEPGTLQNVVPHEFTGELEVVTLEGKMRIDPGDWLIRGVKGELYPCKPDIFEATYEKVEE